MGDGVESMGMEQADTSQEELRLWQVLQQLVEDQGKVGAAKALAVNYRTLVANVKAGSLSRHMRRAVQQFEARPEPSESPDGDGGEAAAQQMETLAGQVAHVAEMVESQTGQLQELGRRVAGLEEVARERTAGNVELTVDEGVRSEWRPPEREEGLPDAVVVTVDPQPDEEHAFGLAAGLVAEWRELRASLRNRSGGDRAKAQERGLELELLLMERYQLTLPPHTEQLLGSEREDYLRRRRGQLAQARRQRITAERRETFRKVVTLGLWR